MKALTKIKLASFMFLMASQSFARNRILEQPHLNLGRSMDEGIPAEDCSREQKNALSNHCINDEEYDTLVKQNYFPSCTKIAGKIKLTGWFTCGCFDPNARIYSLSKSSSESEWNTVRDIVADEQNYQLWSLSDNATLSDFRTETRGILRSSHGPEKKPLVIIHTADGNTLGVTTEHAVLLWSGEMIAARNLKEGQTLVSTTGYPLSLERIEHRIINEDVFNVLSTGKTPLSHMIFAEGIIVGDLAWQNSLQSELNAIALREI